MFCWGTIAAATAAVHNFGGILAARICLGVVEAGFVSNKVQVVSRDADWTIVPFSNFLPDIVLHENGDCEAYIAVLYDGLRGKCFFWPHRIQRLPVASKALRENLRPSGD